MVLRADGDEARRTDDERGRRPRVLVEDADGAGQWALEWVLTRAGYDVTTCGGPHDQPCPVLDGRQCELVDRADLVWNDLGVAGDGARVVGALGRRPGATPVAVHVTLAEQERAPWLFDLPNVETVRAPVTARELVRTVEALMARRLEPDADAGRLS